MKKIKLFNRGSEIRFAMVGFTQAELHSTFLLLHNHGVTTKDSELEIVSDEFAFVRTDKRKLQKGFTSIFFFRAVRELDAQGMERNEAVLELLAAIAAQRYIASLPMEPWGEDINGPRSNATFQTSDTTKDDEEETPAIETPILDAHWQGEMRPANIWPK